MSEWIFVKLSLSEWVFVELSHVRMGICKIVTCQNPFRYCY